MSRVFTPQESFEMACAADGMARLNGVKLHFILTGLLTLDDPYYMGLSPATYKASLRDSDWASQFEHGGWAHDGWNCDVCDGSLS